MLFQEWVILTCPLQTLMQSLATVESNNPLCFCYLGCDDATLCTNDRASQSAHQPLRIGTAWRPLQTFSCEIRFALIAQGTRAAAPIILTMETPANESFSVVLRLIRSEMFVSFGVHQSTPCSTSAVVARIYLLKFCGGREFLRWF